MRGCLAVLLLCGACGASARPTAPATSNAPPVTPTTATATTATATTATATTAATPPAVSDDVVFTGTCDASGAVPLDNDRFAVADDEDNILRIYDVHGGAPLQTLDVTEFLAMPVKKKPQEADIEAATRLGDVALWLTSHGLSSRGRRKPARFRLFATRVQADNSLAPHARPYDSLLEDLIAAAPLQGLDLASAAQIPPKQTGGLNIEGMAERADQRSVWIGFRSPRPQGRALVVALLNPLAMLEGAHAELQGPVLLDLGGLGVRGLSRWRNSVLVLGGALMDEAAPALFVWDEHGEQPTRVDTNLSDLNPEGFVTYQDRDDVLLLSDDGSRPIDGVACKDQPDATRKAFRGRWARIAPAR